MGKRANGEGTIYQRSDGRWVASLTLTNRQRKYFYGNTRKEVSRKLTDAIKAQNDGLPIPGDRQTVAQFLEGWLKDVKPSLRETTFKRYSEYVRLHAIPRIGRLPLSSLAPEHLQRLYADCMDAGLSPTSTLHLHRVLHRALRQATRRGQVARNVAAFVDPPRMNKEEMKTLSPDQVKEFLTAAADHRLEALYVLAVTTGMRQGELLALRWKDVDLDDATLRVTATLQRAPDGFKFVEPKTARSRRRVNLTAAAVDALKRHKVAQAEERLKAPAWEDGNLVFTNKVGQPIDATNLRDSFHPLLKRAGLPRIRFHDLRHTAATMMLAQNIHPKIVSEMLGHANIAITLDLYSHVTPTMQKQATAAIDALLTA